MLVGRVDAASQALIAHEFEGAGAFGVDRRATRDSAAELARVNEALRACERTRDAKPSRRRRRAWSEEPGCAKSLACLGGGNARVLNNASDDDLNSSDDDYADKAETLELDTSERRALAEELQARVGPGCSRAANAVRNAVNRAGRTAAENASDKGRDVHRG